MIFNYNQFVNHNKNFIDTFIDLKVAGWNTYSTALNVYTFNFFKEQLTQADAAVVKIADQMKKGTPNVK